MRQLLIGMPKSAFAPSQAMASTPKSSSVASQLRPLVDLPRLRGRGAGGLVANVKSSLTAVLRAHRADARL